MHEIDLLADIGLAIVTATAMAIAAKAARQPLLLAYLLAGILLGPKIGLGLIGAEETIGLISEIGLILLLFIIGLEIDLGKLRSSGASLFVAGASQFPLCVLFGLAPFVWLGLAPGGGAFDGLYIAVALALSSTMIVVKLLYDKFELTTLPGRVTLGVLVFQDIWAILFLAVQPNLSNPDTASILLSFVKGAGLVAVSMVASKHVLGRLFGWVAKVPELLLVLALAWCFLVSGLAGALGLSREMGALIAGVSLSTFPYNVDVIAKVINIRDFFVTLFFVGLGMQIPMPSAGMLAAALLLSAFLIATRLLSVFPVLFAMRCGMRASLIPSINLSQMSEFSLVIVSLGLSLGHVSQQTVGMLTFVFAITAVLSTYLIQYNHEAQQRVASWLERLGLRDIQNAGEAPAARSHARDFLFLGFFREASSVLHEIEEEAAARGISGIREHVMVVDFNPVVHEELTRRGVECIYGDIASLDTLQHAHCGEAGVVFSSIPDAILRGATNARLLQMARRLCPAAKVVVTADTITEALRLYGLGADFVFLPRLHSARQIAALLLDLRDRTADAPGKQAAEELRARREVLA